jgi:hypothetical protein
MTVDIEAVGGELQAVKADVREARRRPLPPR